MITHITFSDKSMTISARLCCDSAIKAGADESFLYNKESLSDEFLQANHETLRNFRGAGFWLWKPYIIFEQLKDTKPGDFLIYTDAGLQINAEINYIIAAMDQDILLFGNTHPHKRWCKMDVLKAMNCNRPEFLNHEQVQASVILIKKSEWAVKRIEEWLKWAQIPGFIDDSESKAKNTPEFIEHRHDQAILTNIALLNKIRMHWWAAQYNRGNKIKYTDSFPFPLFIHHRKRNNEY